MIVSLGNEDDDDYKIFFFMVSKGEVREFEMFYPGDDGLYCITYNTKGGFFMAWIGENYQEICYEKIS